MAEKRSNLLSNGIDELARNKNDEPVRLWKRIQMNERTCSFLLFLMSLSIVLGKLYVNYGNILQLQDSFKHIVSSRSVFSNVSKFVDISQYDDVVNVLTSFLKMYGWLMRAAICGLIMTGFTWLIIYEDSSIPGINPPSPFSPSKQRLPKTAAVQINYLVGVLNGILIFVYMCL